MIVVGLGYAGDKPDYANLRDDDLCPVISPGRLPSEGLGQADQFLQIIETVAIPLLEKEYQADPKHRFLMGHSSGADFTLHALFSKPNLYQGYVAASPSVFACHWLNEEDFARW